MVTLRNQYKCLKCSGGFIWIPGLRRMVKCWMCHGIAAGVAAAGNALPVTICDGEIVTHGDMWRGHGPPSPTVACHCPSPTAERKDPPQQDVATGPSLCPSRVGQLGHLGTRATVTCDRP